MLTINTKNTTYHQSIVKIFQLDISSNDAMGKLWAAGPPNWTNLCGPKKIRRNPTLGWGDGAPWEKPWEKPWEDAGKMLGKSGL